jgi:OOP family OmpA-OmpF porin
MKKIVLITLLSSAAAAMSVGAHAEGVYVGVAVPTTHYDLTYLAPGAASTAVDGKGYSAQPKLTIGYDINKTWSVEGGYAWLGNADYAYTQNGTAGAVETKSRALYAAAKATLPVTNDISVYGKLGASENRYTIDGSGAAASLSGKTKTTGLYFGVGAEYALTKKVALTLEYENFGKMAADNTRAAAVTVGAKYSF